MRFFRLAILLTFLVALSLSPFSVAHTSPKSAQPDPITDEDLIASYHGVEADVAPGKDDLPGGIREEIPLKYVNRYNEWKEEFLSTDAGRSQWEYYHNNPNFTLNIVVARENAEGATTGKYKWNDAGQLVGATITLGIRLDEGYPNPIYFPVMNSLVPILKQELAATRWQPPSLRTSLVTSIERGKSIQQSINSKRNSSHSTTRYF